jgi:hypothetical protein
MTRELDMTTPASRPAIHPSVTESGEGIWFATPAGFVHLPLKALLSPGSPEPGVARDVWAPLLQSAPDELSRQRIVSQLIVVVRMLRSAVAEGTVHGSLGLHHDDSGDGDESALLSLFTITWVKTTWAPRGVTAARAGVTADGHTNVEYAEVPCGPATFSEMIWVPAAHSGLPPEPLLQIYAHLPHPDGTSLAVLTLGTTAVAQREQYRALLRQIAETVSFEDPFALSASAAGSGKQEELR